jgi:protein-S-isoprenylcysteine O-methyltransferase Ste14
MSVPDLLARRRIGLSWAFAVVFVVALLLSRSRHEGSLAAAALFFAGLLLVGLATVGRLWCSLFISGYKGAELITVGPYSVTRNPLYFFSLLGALGVGLATETVTFVVVFAFGFLLVYPSTIAREEADLRARFGQAFEDYCARTPRFWPRWSSLREPDSYVVSPRIFRRSMGEVVWFVWLVGIIELVEALHELAMVRPLVRLP